MSAGARHALLLACVASAAGCVRVPTWIDPSPCARGEPPEVSELPGVCEERLERAWREQTAFDAVVIARSGRIVFARGQTSAVSSIASVRKSVVSVLFGMAQARGLVDLDASLGEVGVDDESPLTDRERSATVRELMQSRSGVYLPSIGAPGFWSSRMPERGAYAPGEHFFYNNWDFNALGTVFETKTGLTLDRAMEEWLAQPLGMQTFCASHVDYETARFTEHAMYRIYMSAEDLALFGALVASGGAWNGAQLVPREWIEESTRPSSTREELGAYLDEPHYDGFGYMWWTDTTRGHIWGDGFGGQRLLVDPTHEMVSVGRNHTGLSAAGYVWSQTGQREDLGDVAPEDLLVLHEIARECAP